MISAHVYFCFVLGFGAAASLANAQQPQSLDQTAPPLLKLITRVDRQRLSDTKDSKDRVNTTIELAEKHLANAEQRTAALSYDDAAVEAGHYTALIEDVFVFLATLKQDSNKTRDLYKKIELTLRAHGPRLSNIRRTTPLAYAIWIKEIEDLARRARTEALNSFYGHTVFRDRPPLSDKPAPPLQNSAVTPAKKP